MNRGYFGIGIENVKSTVNVGTLWRSAFIMGAAFIFTTGKRYKRQASDTVCAWRHVPLFHYESITEFYQTGLPYDCRLIGIELTDKATGIKEFCHPERAVYLLGAEDNGLTPTAMDFCHQLIVIPGKFSLNVAVAGSIVMFDRIEKQ